MKTIACRRTTPGHYDSSERANAITRKRVKGTLVTRITCHVSRAFVPQLCEALYDGGQRRKKARASSAKETALTATKATQKVFLLGFARQKK